MSSNAALITMLTDKFHVPAQDITPDSTLDDLDIDSLALAELSLTLQDQLGVKIEEHEATKDTTVAELTATIDARLDAAPAL
ncbi:acyl carrier protein [Lentzea sp. NPDC092896]|uniref:acyl carrier protein n=1 Tax=Lentzea sp. NPDC092896 TaxID=3364127 RepID=UPI00382D3690